LVFMNIWHHHISHFGYQQENGTFPLGKQQKLSSGRLAHPARGDSRIASVRFLTFGVVTPNRS
jgi:hypothetical protein